MTLKRLSVSLISILFSGLLLSGCAQESSNGGNKYCNSPAPLEGQENPDSYIVYLKDNVSVAGEVNRLMGVYEIQVNGVYFSLNGFHAEMNDDTREKLRCEVRVASIRYNDVVSIQ